MGRTRRTGSTQGPTCVSCLHGEARSRCSCRCRVSVTCWHRPIAPGRRCTPLTFTTGIPRMAARPRSHPGPASVVPQSPSQRATLPVMAQHPGRCVRSAALRGRASGAAPETSGSLRHKLACGWWRAACGLASSAPERPWRTRGRRGRRVRGQIEPAAALSPGIPAAAVTSPRIPSVQRQNSVRARQRMGGGRPQAAGRRFRRVSPRLSAPTRRRAATYPVILLQRSPSRCGSGTHQAGARARARRRRDV